MALEISEQDRDIMEQALILLESTLYYQGVQEDSDWNITQSVDRLREALNGNHWI